MEPTPPRSPRRARQLAGAHDPDPRTQAAKARSPGAPAASPHSTAQTRTALLQSLIAAPPSTAMSRESRQSIPTRTGQMRDTPAPELLPARPPYPHRVNQSPTQSLSQSASRPDTSAATQIPHCFFIPLLRARADRSLVQSTASPSLQSARINATSSPRARYVATRPLLIGGVTRPRARLSAIIPVLISSLLPVLNLVESSTVPCTAVPRYRAYLATGTSTPPRQPVQLQRIAIDAGTEMNQPLPGSREAVVARESAQISKLLTRLTREALRGCGSGTLQKSPQLMRALWAGMMASSGGAPTRFVAEAVARWFCVKKFNVGAVYPVGVLWAKEWMGIESLRRVFPEAFGEVSKGGWRGRQGLLKERTSRVVEETNAEGKVKKDEY